MVLKRGQKAVVPFVHVLLGENFMRKKVIAGNWKMNMLPDAAIRFIDELTPLVKDAESEVILCVPYTDLFYALLTAQNTNINPNPTYVRRRKKNTILFAASITTGNNMSPPNI